jgi:hypothetical protein
VQVATATYRVLLDLARMRANFENDDGLTSGHAEIAAWLLEAGFVLGPDGGYLADEFAVARLRPDELVSKRAL